LRLCRALSEANRERSSSAGYIDARPITYQVGKKIPATHGRKARTFELRAALALAKLYHSTDRSADAHAVLASALKRFSPTPEFPEIAEAQTLLSALRS
jgi:hypothetical protein